MSANTFGELFRISTFGESHGMGVGVVIDGCPAGLLLSESDIQLDLDRRKPGQSHITTTRSEADRITIYSGLFEGKTTGAPIMMMVGNTDHRSNDYENLKSIVRPGHADYTYNLKYGNRDPRGGGRSSARIMIGRVAAGAIAKKYLKEMCNIEFLAFTQQVGTIRTEIDISTVAMRDVESNIVRCPDQKIAAQMIHLIEEVKSNNDSIGGIIQGLIKNVPAGLGEPEFDKLPALLSHAMMSINATKGFEIGSGFAGVSMQGSIHNDVFYTNDQNTVKTKTNHAGGTLGGISNGQNITFRVAIKPVATIAKTQSTIDIDGKPATFEGKGRHDPCVLPRAVPIVEAMAALVIMDLYLRNKCAH
jgi:chorismate synthase